MTQRSTCAHCDATCIYQKKKWDTVRWCSKIHPSQIGVGFTTICCTFCMPEQSEFWCSCASDMKHKQNVGEEPQPQTIAVQKKHPRLFCCQSGLLLSKEKITGVKKTDVNHPRSSLIVNTLIRCIRSSPSALLTFQSLKSFFKGFVASVGRVLKTFYLRISIVNVRCFPSTQTESCNTERKLTLAESFCCENRIWNIAIENLILQLQQRLISLRDWCDVKR